MTPRDGRAFWIGAVVGGAGIAWGLRGIVVHRLDTRPANLAKFFVGDVIIHDALWAPLVLAGGVAVARLVRGRARSWVQAALICAGLLAVFAYPEIRGYGHANANPTSLPHDYLATTAVAAAVTLAGVAAAVLVASRLRRR